MKKIRVLLAVMLTILSLTHSHPSQAVAGLVSGGGAIVGLKLIGYGASGVVGTMVVGTILRESGGDIETTLTGLWLVSAAATLVGIVILEGENQIAFQPINEESKSKLGLTEKERLSFNEEIDQANMLLREVNQDLEKLEKPSEQDLVKAWNQVKDLVNPLTFSAMVKIASQKK